MGIVLWGRVVTLRDEPLRARVHLPQHVGVLVALLRVALGDAHAAKAALVLVLRRGLAPGVAQSAQAGLGRRRGRRADEVEGVVAVSVDGRVEPLIEGGDVCLDYALVDDALLAGDGRKVRRVLGRVHRLAEGKWALERRAAALILDVVDDEAVRRQNSRTSSEFGARLASLNLARALPRRS